MCVWSVDVLLSHIDRSINPDGQMAVICDLSGVQPASISLLQQALLNFFTVPMAGCFVVCVEKGARLLVWYACWQATQWRAPTLRSRATSPRCCRCTTRSGLASCTPTRHPWFSGELAAADSAGETVRVRLAANASPHTTGVGYQPVGLTWT